MSPEQDKELDCFFSGLDAGLNSLCEVRSIYDELVAFEFNSTSFFAPKENKTSDILAFFLDPTKPHGQKTTFLKLFLESFRFKDLDPQILLRKSINVHREDSTADNRRIDITVHFGNNEYVIGIENKIWARDQDKQLTAYAKELKEITKSDDKWVLFYLTPDGHVPAKGSITPEDRESLEKSGNLKIISYSEDIIQLVGQFELACKADNVRAFLKDFKQYLREQYRQESIMDEQAFIKKHIKEHPNLIVNIAHLNAAVVTLREDYQRKLVDELRKQLRDKGVDLGNPVEDGQGGRNTHDWVVKTTMFGKTEIDIRIQADWSRGGFELRNGVSNNSAEVPTFYKLLQEAIRETEPNYGAGSGWYGGYYELSGRDCLSNERLAQLLESPKRLQEIVRDWVSRINKYIETVDWVCKEQQ